MQTKLGGILRLMLCVVAAIMLTVPAWAGGEVYVVAAKGNGDADYMGSYGDGSFSSLETLQITQDSGITAYPLSWGNGLGDFDNDGEYDYIAGFGYGGGNIYISKKLGVGNQFAPPVNVASWNEGYYPMDMAVADFDGDGKQDFVLSIMYSPNCGLYLGDGNFGFTFSALANTAPNYSAGVDAADFNNDGFADFVVAPNSSSEPIYVNLGNGDGTFTTQTFSTHDGNAVYGIAAADFNNDGIADIATANYYYLIIYTGAGDGTFQWSGTYEFGLNQSAIDNYDFNGDGKQDLVAANFGAATDGVAVLLGNGDGTFTLDVTYTGTGGYLNAVTAPPYEPEPNPEPAAVLDPISVKVAFTPHTLNLDSKGKWIEATIRVPADYDARQIDIASVQIVPDGGTAIGACTDNKFGFFKRLFNKHGSKHTLTVKFERQAVVDALDGASGKTSLTVEGKLLSDDEEVYFSAAGTIKVIGKHKKHVQHGKKYGKK